MNIYINIIAVSVQTSAVDQNQCFRRVLSRTVHNMTVLGVLSQLNRFCRDHRCAHGTRNTCGNKPHLCDVRHAT